jgi:hypothetical protein
LNDKLEAEVNAVRREAVTAQKPVEPTDEERRNGWSTKTLTAYLAERQAGQSIAVDVNSISRQAARRPNEQNHAYRPHRWRG